MPVTASLSRASIVALLGNDPIDNNFGLGCVILGRYGFAAVATGAIIAGSNLTVACLSTAGDLSNGSAMAGSWRLIGNALDGASNIVSTFQRVA